MNILHQSKTVAVPWSWISSSWQDTKQCTKAHFCFWTHWQSKVWNGQSKSKRSDALTKVLKNTSVEHLVSSSLGCWSTHSTRERERKKKENCKQLENQNFCSQVGNSKMPSLVRVRESETSYLDANPVVKFLLIFIKLVTPLIEFCLPVALFIIISTTWAKGTETWNVSLSVETSCSQLLRPKRQYFQRNHTKLFTGRFRSR